MDVFSFRIPGSPGDQYVIPVSGGADSTALAIHLVQRYPATPWKLVFTDTLQEPDSTYESLDRLETFLGLPITRLTPAKGLYDLVRGFNGFLPSGGQRWCTRMLKTEPYEAWIKGIRKDAETIWSFVGIRVDEDRTGLISHMDYIQTIMPFVELGMNREDVYRILRESIGIPSFYRNKTRSGCVSCFFQRRTEVIALAKSQPLVFLEAADVEKVRNAPAIDRPFTGQFVFPFFREILNPPKRKLPHRSQGQTIDLLRSEPMDDWFVGAEFFIDPNVGCDGIWWQDLVTFGKTLGGVNRALAFHYQHRIATSQVVPWELDADEMHQQLHLAVYHLQVPLGTIPGHSTDPKDYTWRKGESYLGIFHQLQAFQQVFADIFRSDKDSNQIINRWRFAPPEKLLEESENHSVCLACSN